MVAPGFTCPVCGEEVHPNARACPSCGADDRSGWRDDAGATDDASALGLGDDEDFDYDEFVAREFGAERPASPRQGWVWWAVAVLLLGALAAAWLLPR